MSTEMHCEPFRHHPTQFLHAQSPTYVQHTHKESNGQGSPMLQRLIATEPNPKAQLKYNELNKQLKGVGVAEAVHGLTPYSLVASPKRSPPGRCSPPAQRQSGGSLESRGQHLVPLTSSAEPQQMMKNSPPPVQFFPSPCPPAAALMSCLQQKNYKAHLLDSR